MRGDSTAVGAAGLVVLLRQGVAAWLAYASTSPTETAGVSAPIPTALIVSNHLHAEVVIVLANMVMTFSPEVHA